MTVGNIVLQGSTRRTGVSNTPWDTTTNVPFVSSMNSPYLAVASTGADSSAIDRWWDITATPSILPVDSITFTYDGLENTLLTPFRTGAIFPQNWTGTFWSDKNQTCPVCSNGVTGAGVPGTVTIYNDTIDAAPWILVGFPIRLPIELLSFTAMLSDGKVLVDWATASETNNNYFTLEKSKDGKTFGEVGNVDGAGNSSTVNVYHLIDQQPYIGLSYYRLRQTDYDGHFTYSELVSVYNRNKNSSWYIFPNPAKDYITIAKTGDDMTDVLFQLFSLEGSLLKSIPLKTKSQHVFSVDIKDCSSGIYIGKIFDDYQQQVFKIVKK